MVSEHLGGSAYCSETPLQVLALSLGLQSGDQAISLYSPSQRGFLALLRLIDRLKMRMWWK